MYAKQKPSATADEVIELMKVAENIPENQLIHFVQDFEVIGFSEAIKKKPDLVEAWKVLDGAGETKLSGRIKDIELVDDY